MSYFRYNDKNVYYEEKGNGTPLLLLHGNTASSKMFDSVVELYASNFKLLLIDFLGHGKSDRLDKFQDDFWYDEAMQAVELILQNNYKKVNIIGSSGGALVALNIALEHSNLVNKVIADSFEGEKALDIVAEIIPNDRKQSKLNQDSIDFWWYNHGNDWESIIDNDTDVIIRHHKSVVNFFHKDLALLNVPVMLTASMKDEFAEIFDFNSAYKNLQAKIPDCALHFFKTGGHPAMLSNAKEFSDNAKRFFAD